LNNLPFLELVRDDLDRVEVLLLDGPQEQHEAVRMAVDHLIGGGGKRLRPALVLLTTHICGADLDRAIFAAAGAEMLHTATLIHDDLVDGSLIRRGMETLNARWSPGATVLTGDYVFARAAYLIACTENVRLVRRFAETLMVICNGEIKQMLDGQHCGFSRREYEQRIFAKTASLVALSAEAGPILAGADEDVIRALRLYGENLGMAFQIVDDVLDFVADEETLGKPIGSDLRQGLLTLPVLLVLEAEPAHPVINRVLEHNPPTQQVVQDAVQLVAASPTIEQALDVAREYAEQATVALGDLPHSPYLQALYDLAEFTVRRRF
jgi:geranylgeranyl pyrophosphate synthase